MSVCLTVYEIFSVKEWRDLESGGKGRSKSLEMAPYSSILYQLSSYLTLNALNNREGEKVTEGHSNWYHSKDWVRFPIRLL